MLYNHQKGVSLIITFLVMTIILAIVLSISVILFSEIKITGNIGNATQSLYSAETGAEKTLYFDQKQIPIGGIRGFCNMCNACSSDDCIDCSVKSLATDGSDGCDLISCNNCQVTYASYFEDKSYVVNATVTPDPSNSDISIFNINAKGFYKGTTRAIEATFIK